MNPQTEAYMNMENTLWSIIHAIESIDAAERTVLEQEILRKAHKAVNNI
jgi:hypothetical protein